MKHFRNVNEICKLSISNKHLFVNVVEQNAKNVLKEKQLDSWNEKCSRKVLFASLCGCVSVERISQRCCVNKKWRLQQYPKAQPNANGKRQQNYSAKNSCTIFLSVSTYFLVLGTSLLCGSSFALHFMCYFFCSLTYCRTILSYWDTQAENMVNF